MVGCSSFCSRLTALEAAGKEAMVRNVVCFSDVLYNWKFVTAVRDKGCSDAILNTCVEIWHDVDE